MNSQLPSPTDKQLNAFVVMQRIRMAWVALWVILILFVIALLSFLYAVFFIDQQNAAKLILGGIDGVLGFSVKAIISYLFPSKTPKA